MPVVKAQQYETVDSLAYRISGNTDALETIYADNPGLAELGPFLPLGTNVTVPEDTTTVTTVRQRTTLWS
ncbi:tail protein X [Oceanobacter kriegii]|uniref:tail protein X n=1 Tax=Oceanobacter kriegii TaxID=64972 RepID=UPI00041288CA|nr:tail protein X [Oceanobacter kriegii]